MPKGYDSETITVGATSVGFTAAKLTSYPIQAICGVEGESIKISFDESDPATNGITLLAGTVFEVDSLIQLQKFRMIRAGASDATVKVQYIQG